MNNKIKEIKIDKNAKSIFFINNGICFSQFGIADEILDLIINLQEENERLKEKVENLTTLTVCRDRKQIKNTAQYKLEIAQERIDKAIYFIDTEETIYEFKNTTGYSNVIDYIVDINDFKNKLTKILKGEDNDN